MTHPFYHPMAYYPSRIAITILLGLYAAFKENIMFQNENNNFTNPFSSDKKRHPCQFIIDAIEQSPKHYRPSPI